MYSDQVFSILTKIYGWWKDDLCALYIFRSDNQSLVQLHFAMYERLQCHNMAPSQ